jgi:Spy/CpxP family protein refolding chaperone
MKRMMIVFTLAAMSVFAQGPGFGGPRGEGRGQRLEQATFDALKTYLTLTDAQVTQLKAVLQKQAEANKPVMEQIRAKQQQIAEEMKKDAPSPTVVGNLMVEVKKLRDSIRDKSGATSTDALAVLTPAQQTKLKELEAAQKAVPAVHQAELLGLLARPEPPAGFAAAMRAGRANQAMRAPGMRRMMRNQI